MGHQDKTFAFYMGLTNLLSDANWWALMEGAETRTEELEQLVLDSG